MNDKIYKLSEHSSYKAVLVKENDLYISNILYNSVEKLIDYVTKEKDSSFVHVFPITNIKKLSIKAENKEVKLEQYSSSNFSLDFISKRDAETFGNYLGLALNYNKVEKADKKLNDRFYGNILGAIVAFGLGIYFYLKNPVEVLQTKGKRTGLFRLFYAFIFDNFGTIGFLLLGSIIAIVLGFFAYRSFLKPSTVTIYKKLH